MCVCLSVCLSVCYCSSGGSFHSNAQTKVQAALVRYSLDFRHVDFCKMLRSEVMASFAYRESHQLYYRIPELIPSTTQGYKVVQKPNRALYTTWNTS